MFKKIVFMGTPDFSVPILKSLYQNSYPIVTVYTQPPQKSNRGQKINKSPVHKVAENLRVKIRTPETLKDNLEEYNFLKLLNPDLIIVVAYGQLIPKEYLSLSKNGFINIHTSLLPKWRGAAPIERALMNQDSKTGISIMKITEKLDAGPIMKQEIINIEKNVNSFDLRNRLASISSKIILDCINDIEKGDAVFKEQNEEDATYAKKINKAEGQIKWDDSANKIISKINSLYPSPGAWFSYMGERYKIFNAVISDLQGKIGEVLDDNLIISCGNKSIKILKIQRQGKNIQNIDEFVLGSKIKKGNLLI